MEIAGRALAEEMIMSLWEVLLIWIGIAESTTTTTDPEATADVGPTLDPNG